MKLFLIGLGHMRREQIEVARALQKNHTIQYWVRMRRHFEINESEFRGTVFHRYSDALKGLPAEGIEPNSFEPWSRKDILAYADVESEFMSMVDKWYPDWSVNRRKDLFYDLLRYWGGVLERFQPDCIIISVVPHEMYSFVLYKIARQRGIRTIILDAILENDRYVLVEDYMLGSSALAQYAQHHERPITLDDLSSEMRDHYVRVSGSKHPSPPAMQAFMSIQTPWHQARRFLRALRKFMRDGSVIERGVRKLFKLFKPNLVGEYRAFERTADLNKPYVYLPLHYQPEATTSPQGGIFVDQLLAVKMLSAALPSGWELYVKEHPAQHLVHGGNTTPARYPGFYSTIATLRNVRLMSTQEDTFALTDRAQATATVAGTAAWESILRGKCALVFGYPWFMHAPGILRVESVGDCKNALEKIINGFAPKKDDVLRYLSVVDRVKLHGYLQATTPGYEDQWSAMHRAIEEALASKNSIVRG